MKITIVLGAFFPVPPMLGGAVEKAWFALAHQFAARGHEVTMISRAMPELAREETAHGIHHVRVRGFDTPRSLLRLKVLDLIYSMRANRALPRADVLVTNTFWLPLLVGRYPKGQMRFYRRAARLQAPSRDIATAIAREAPSLAHKTIAIPYPRPENVEVAGCARRENIVLYVGRVHPEKGVHLLVEAFSRLAGSELAGWTLVIVGPTETEHGGGGESYAARLRELAVNARVEFRGAIFDEAQLAREYQRARVFVYPSLATRGETFGLAPLEAMSHGCTVVVSDLACFRDFITNEETGVVFGRNSADPAAALASTLHCLISEPERLARIAQTGRAKSDEFSLASVADKFLADFTAVISDAEPANR